MINIECKHCKGTNKINEADYEPGSHVVVYCKRCGEDIEVDIPGRPEEDSVETVPVIVEHGVSTVGRTSDTSSSMAPSNVELEKAKMMLEAEKIRLEHRRMDHEERMRETELDRQRQWQGQSSEIPANKSLKSKTTAGLLGIFLGGLGAHKFYMGKTGMGIVYLLFCWTYIPGILGLIEGIMYLTKSDEDFHRSY